MKKIAKILTLGFLLYPAVAIAEWYNAIDTPSGAEVPFNAPGIRNPLRVNSFLELVNVVLDIILQIAVPIAVIFIIWAGFLFVFSRGNPEKLKTARKAFFGAVIGIALLFGARYLAEILVSTLNQIRSENVRQ